MGEGSFSHGQRIQISKKFGTYQAFVSPANHQITPIQIIPEMINFIAGRDF
jgi:hypothetical protein